jgi:hypothetical protein
MNKNQSVYKEGMAILKNMGEKHNLLYNRVEPRSTTDGESSGYNPPKRVRIPPDLQHYLTAESPSQLSYYNTYIRYMYPYYTLSNAASVVDPYHFSGF